MACQDSHSYNRYCSLYHLLLPHPLWPLSLYGTLKVS
jgi:hypothetical protein